MLTESYLAIVSGVVNVRTHTTAYVVNKANRYHRNSGFDDQPVRSLPPTNSDNGIKDVASINSPNLPLNNLNTNSLNFNRTKRSSYECISSTALTLIRQPTESFVSGLNAPFNADSICLATAFGISRGFLNPEDMINHQDQSSKACSSLFIISWHGRLIEYVLEPIPGKRRISILILHFKSFFQIRLNMAHASHRKRRLLSKPLPKLNGYCRSKFNDYFG